MILLPLVAALAHAGDACPADVDGDGVDDASSAFTRWLCVEEVSARLRMDGDAARAASLLETMAHNELPSDDPALAMAWLRLGEARTDQADLDGARRALDACVRTGMLRGPCLDLRGALDQEAEAVRTVPTTWTFDRSVHGMFHPRAYWDKGAIRLRTHGDRSVLVWTTEVDGIEEDALVMAFAAPRPAPRVVRVSMRSSRLDAEIEVDLVDDEGRAFAARPRSFEVPRDTWTVLEIPLVDAPPLAPSGSPLRPGSLASLVLRDATGMTGAVGPNELWIDTIEVR